MAEIQEFCLKWNNYQSNLASAFLDLKRGEDFVDVTLACDGRSVQAHRVVLSACSPFFRDLLKATPCKHPIVVLKDVSFGDLVALIEFMYQGEVKVGQDGLSSFLRTAEVLRIKGLTEEPSTQKRPRQDTEHAVSPTYRGKSWLKADRQISTPPPSLSQPVVSHSFTGLPPPSMSIVPQNQVPTQQSNDFGVEKQLRLSSSIAITKKLRLIPSAAVPEPVELPQPPNAASPSNWHPERDTSVISHNPNHFNPITVRSKAEMIELETSSGSDCIEKEEDEDRNYPTPQLHVHMPSSLGEPPEDPSFRMLPNDSQHEINGAMDVGTSLPLNRIPELSHMLGPYQGSAEPISTEKNSGRTVTHQRPRWQCPFCSRLLSSRSSVRRHVEDRHTTDGSRQQCPICERQYRTRNSLQFHLSTAHRDRDPSLRMRRRFRNAMVANVSALAVPEFKNLPPPVPLMPQKLAEAVVNTDEDPSVIVKVEEQPRIGSFNANATL